jgi:hypothetical protein
MVLCFFGSAYATELTPPSAQSYVTQQEFREFTNRTNDRNINSYITIKDYIDTRFSSLEQKTESAREAMEKRLDGMNEFRLSLRDQSSLFINKSEFNAVMSKIDENNKRYESELKSLQLTRAEVEGKASQMAALIALFVALMSLLIGLFSILFSLRIRNGYKLSRSE